MRPQDHGKSIPRVITVTGEGEVIGRTAAGVRRTEKLVSDPLNVESLRTEKQVIVRVSGDAGLANVSRLEAELTSVAATQPPLVIVDLSDLAFIASRAMGVLMGFHRRMTLQQGQVRVVAPASRVRDALEIARLHNVLDVYDSVGDALRG